MNKHLLFTLIICLFFVHQKHAQSVKFGKVEKVDFADSYYEKDSSANAVVIYKKRDTHFQYDDMTGWKLVTEIHERIRFYNADGFKHATKKVRFYNGGENESVNIKGYTYNIENENIVKTKLDKKEIFLEKASENWTIKSFTMPNIKDGSIVEWRISISSPYTTYIDDVICQYDIPIKYLECKVQIPEYYVFNFYPSRYYPLKIKKSSAQKRYQTQSGSVGVTEKAYSLKQEFIPALVEEKYVNNINNYRAKIKFEIAAFNPRNGPSKLYNTSWERVTKTIYQNTNFGGELKKSNHFKEDLANIKSNSSNQNEEIVNIFEFVKNKIKWNKSNGKYTSADGIKSAYKNGIGNVADINLTLVAMLKEAGVNAHPILVSTRSHGIPLFPTKKGFNSVIAGVEQNGEVILMDASAKYSSLNVLPRKDLNWEGRLVRDDGTSTKVSLYPKVYNLKNVKLNAKINTEGTVEGLMITTYNGLNALEYRTVASNQKEEDIIALLESNYRDIEIEKFRISNKEKCSKPLSEMLQFTQDNGADIIGDKIYISPLLFLTVNENPFKLKERLYPIDYASPWSNKTNISLEIPEGYILQSKPEDLALTLPDQMGTYILKTEFKNNKILVTSQTNLNIPVISSIHYSSIKELYKKAIENQLEKIVLVQGP